MAKKKLDKALESSSIKDETIEKDKKYDAVEAFVLTQATISISQIQKEFKVGYKRAKNILDALEANNIVGAKEGSKPRNVITKATEVEEVVEDIKVDEDKEIDEVVEKVEDDKIVEDIQSDSTIEDEPKIHHQKILSIKELAIGIGIILALIIAMVISNNVTQSSEEQKLIDEYTLPIRASFSNEVKEEPIEKNDVVIISFTGYMNGEEVENTSAKNARIIVGSSNIIDNFDDNLIGHKKGDKFDSVLTFPDDYPTSDLAGQEITFKVVINNVFKLRELDDSLVKEIAKEGKKVNNDALANLKTVEDLENLIKEQIEMQKQIEQYSQDSGQ